MQIFSSILWIAFVLLLIESLDEQTSFNFQEIQFACFFSFVTYTLDVIAKKSLPNPRLLALKVVEEGLIKNRVFSTS